MDNVNLSGNCASLHLKEVIVLNNSERQKLARRRWAILAKTLKGKSPNPEELSRISSFMLIKTSPLTSLAENAATEKAPVRTWHKYSLTVDTADFCLNVCHLNRPFSVEELTGFNNTGNICVWPSEEALSHYACANLSIFKDKKVLEVGGGMTCLAGLYVAKYSVADAVTVTDGNELSVENVKAALFNNTFRCPITCKVLRWGYLEEDVYDVILSADCLFFDDVRSDLIDCLWSGLNEEGLGLIMAPERGGTLNGFIVQAENKGFCCKKIVWEKRVNLLSKWEHIEYPVLVVMTKKKCP